MVSSETEHLILEILEFIKVRMTKIQCKNGGPGGDFIVFNPASHVQPSVPRTLTCCVATVMIVPAILFISMLSESCNRVYS